MSGDQRLINHGAIQETRAKAKTHIDELKRLQQEIHSMGDSALSGWVGQSGEAFASVKQDIHLFFGALISSAENLNEGLSQAGQDFQAADDAISRNMGG